MQRAKKFNNGQSKYSLPQQRVFMTRKHGVDMYILSAIFQILKSAAGRIVALLFFILCHVSSFAQQAENISGPLTRCAGGKGQYFLNQEPSWKGPGVISGTPIWSASTPDAQVIWSSGGTAIVEFYSSGVSSVNVSYTLYYQNYNVYESYNGYIIVNVETPSSTPTTILGEPSACVSSSGNIYTTASGKAEYYWTVPGGTITSGAATNSITVTWHVSGSQQVSLESFDDIGCPGEAAHNVIINPIPVTTITDGPQSSCVGNTVSYTADGSSGSFNWNILPLGAGTINSGQGTNNISVTWYVAGAHSVNVTRTDNSCVSPPRHAQCNSNRGTDSYNHRWSTHRLCWHSHHLHGSKRLRQL